MQDAAVPPPPRPVVPEVRAVRSPFSKDFGLDAEAPYAKDFSLHAVRLNDEVETEVEVENQLHPKDASVDSEESRMTEQSSDPSQEELPLDEPPQVVSLASLQKSAPSVEASSPTPPVVPPSPPSLKTPN